MDYIPCTKEDEREMLRTIGVDNIGALFQDVPDSVRIHHPLNLPEPLSEPDLLREMECLAQQNRSLGQNACFLGAGAYDHFIPSAIDALISRQEFITAYTPYQPEISQGTLTAIFEYQTMISELTGLPISNASLYDGGSALAEAAMLAVHTTGKNEILIARSVHPESREVLQTYAKFRDIQIKTIAFRNGVVDLDDLKANLSSDTAGVIVQNPNFFGIVENLDAIGEVVRTSPALFIASVDPISLALLKSPGQCGVDVAVGEGQSLGNPVSFGGPYLGFIAAQEKLLRKMPGRIVGQTKDVDGKRGFVLTIQSREQHIRREKATSNICSNQGLNALAATIYLTLMGKEGLKKVANLSLQKAHYTHDLLLKTGKFTPVFDAPFFKEFLLLAREPISTLNNRLLQKGIIGGLDVERFYTELKNGYLIAVTEMRTRSEIDQLVNIV